jgi:hypothetical protein
VPGEKGEPGKEGLKPSQFAEASTSFRSDLGIETSQALAEREGELLDPISVRNSTPPYKHSAMSNASMAQPLLDTWSWTEQLSFSILL